MKIYHNMVLLLCIGIIIAGILLLFCQGYDTDVALSIIASQSWEIKKREIRSRLLSVPVLLYHNIDGKGVFSVTSEVLKEHFELFRLRGIRVIGLADLIERHENAKPFQDRVVVLSFDDGYPSMYTRLLPLAREFSYPITLFVYGNAIGKGSRNLNWKRVREMDRSGIDIQCHTISHPDLVKLAMKQTPETRRRLFEEIYLSKRLLELYLEKKISYFAFPYGRYDLYTVDLCKQAGYERVFSTDYGSNIITRNNYCLRRRHIKNDYSNDLIYDLVK